MALISSKHNGDDPKGAYTYEYPRPSMTADNVIFGFDGDRLQILLVERGLEPYKGCWALPGGFMRMNESIEQCARRELLEETNVHDVYLEQFHVFSDPKRDPRGRVVTVAFIALVRPSDHAVIGGDDASKAMWFDVEMLPPLAFDHQKIVDMAREHLKESLRIKPVAFQLLNEVFTVDELRRVYEVISGNSYDRRNFHRKLMQTGMVSDVKGNNYYSPVMCDSTPCGSDDDFEGGSPICNSYCAEPSIESRSKSRKTRFFRLNKDRKKDSGSEEDASIKDLFNF